MMHIPTDEAFIAFVTELRNQGLSSISIAAALNTSSWASPDGKRWHPQQVADLCWGGDAEPIGATPESSRPSVLTLAGDEARTPSAAPCERADCRYHRQLTVLRAIRNWLPFDLEACRVIASSYQDADSAETIAARLNRAGLGAPTGRRWSGALVHAVAHVYAVDEPAGTQGATTHDNMAA